MFMEVKKAGGKPSPLQTKFVREMQEHGTVAVIVDNVKDGVEILEAFAARNLKVKE